MHSIVGLSDLDYNVLLNTSIESLQTLCSINKHFHSLCQLKQFWIDKMKHDGILLPYDMLSMPHHYLNWFKVYNINDIIYHVFFDPQTKIGKYEIAEAISPIDDIDYYQWLFKQSKLPRLDIETGTKVTSVDIVVDTNNDDMFYMYVNDKYGADETHVTSLTLYVLIFTAMVDGVILNFNIASFE